jgi:hypothetical protein
MVENRSYAEELITPELAREYLTFNTHNRPLKPARVRAYAEEMRSGNWRCNGEAIKFGEDDSGQPILFDGQNRLHAILEAKVPITMLVVRGLGVRDQEVMDTGVNRKLNDVLALRGESNSNNLAAAVRAMYIWDHTEDPTKRKLGGSGQTPGNAIATVAMLLPYFDEHSDLCRRISNESQHIRRTTRIPTSVVAPLVREFERLDPEDAKDFWYRLENMLPSPKNLGEADPLVQLSKALRRMFETNKARYLPTEMGALIVKAWNAYRAGTPIVQLRWRSGGSAPEAFPEAL